MLNILFRFMFALDFGFLALMHNQGQIGTEVPHQVHFCSDLSFLLPSHLSPTQHPYQIIIIIYYHHEQYHPKNHTHDNFHYVYHTKNKTHYRSLVESILTFNIVTFYGHLTVKQKNRLNKIVNVATKLINLKLKSLNDLYHKPLVKTSRSIINDPTHPLHSCFEIMPSGKRYRTPAFKRQLYNKSFIPSAVRFLNSQKIL